MLYALYHPQNTENESAGSISTGSVSSEYVSPAYTPFHFTIERKKHIRGEWRSVTAALFPNFQFLECTDEEAERLKEEHLPLISIPEELSELLDGLCDKDHHISMSKGIIRNGLAHVTEGPLIGYDNRIVRVDRHKRLAWMKVSENAARDFGKNSTSMLMVGLEIAEKIS